MTSKIDVICLPFRNDKSDISNWWFELFYKKKATYISRVATFLFRVSFSREGNCTHILKRTKNQLYLWSS